MLQKVNVALSPKEQCRAFYNGVGGPIVEQLKYSVFDTKMICAGDSKHDTCQVTIFIFIQIEMHPYSRP